MGGSHQSWYPKAPSDDLSELLEASLLLARPEQLWDDDDMERVHVELELMFLEEAR